MQQRGSGELDERFRRSLLQANVIMNLQQLRFDRDRRRRDRAFPEEPRFDRLNGRPIRRRGNDRGRNFRAGRRAKSQRRHGHPENANTEAHQKHFHAVNSFERAIKHVQGRI